MAAHKLFHAIVIVGASVTGGCHEPEPRATTPVEPGPSEESEVGDRGSESEVGDRGSESESEVGDREPESEPEPTMAAMRRTTMGAGVLTTGDPDDPDDGMLLIL